MHETIQELLADLGIEPNYTNATLQYLAAADSKYLRDLKLNTKAVLTSEHLFALKAKALEATDAEIADAQACASLLAANNVFYRFRHFVDKEVYNNAPAKLRMNIMMNPVLGKEFFELVSLAVSAVNGCEMCVKSHEQSVLHAGGTENRIWDSIRLASIITSLGKVIY